MFYTPEFIITALLVVGLLIYFLRPKYKDQKLALLLKYRRVRSKSLMMQDLLSTHILTHDAMKKIFVLPDITYGEYLRQLKKAHSQHLSEKVYIKVKNSRSIMFLKKISRVIDEQEQKLNDIEDRVLALETTK
jgi:hypothetical protein